MFIKNSKIFRLSIIFIGFFLSGFFAWQVFGSTLINLALKTNIDLERGLVGHWAMDGPDAIQNIADKSGQGNTGFLILGAGGNTSTTTAPRENRPSIGI